MRYRDLVEDGHVPGLLVHPDWYEERHPQELPIDASDAVAIYRPAPELSVNEGEFDVRSQWDDWIETNCPSSPLNLRFFESTFVANKTIVAGDRLIPVEDAVNYSIGECYYVELDGGGWFIGIVDTETRIHDTRCFLVYSLNDFRGGVASPGNQVFIGIKGSKAPLMSVAWDNLTDSITIDPGDALPALFTAEVTLGTGPFTFTNFASVGSSGLVAVVSGANDEEMSFNSDAAQPGGTYLVTLTPRVTDSLTDTVVGPLAVYTVTVNPIVAAWDTDPLVIP